MKKIIFWHYTLLILAFQTPLCSLKATTQKEDFYYLKVTVKEVTVKDDPKILASTTIPKQGKEEHKQEDPVSLQKGEEIKVTFEFICNEKPLTVEQALSLYATYKSNEEVQAMFLAFTKQIEEITEKYCLWEGFKLKSNLQKGRDFVYEMTGKSWPGRVEPNTRQDDFMKWDQNDTKTSRYQQIKDEIKTKKGSENTFQKYRNRLVDREEEFQTVAFTNQNGNNILVTPKKEVTTIYDFAKEASDEEIKNFWLTTLSIWEQYSQDIILSLFNTGHTYAAQTVPHAHGKNKFNRSVRKGFEIVAWGNKKDVTWETINPKQKDINRKFALNLDGVGGTWQIGQKIVVPAVLCLLVVVWRVYRNMDVERKVSKKKNKRRKKRKRKKS